MGAGNAGIHARHRNIDGAALRSLRKVFCSGDVAGAEHVFAPDYVEHDPDAPTAARGPEGVRRFLDAYRQAFPDLRLHVEEQIVEGDTVLTRWRGRGTHLGPLLEQPPSGRRVSLRGVTVTRFHGSRAVEGWSNWQVPSRSRARGARSRARAHVSA